MASAYLFVDKSVAALEIDVITDGSTATSLLDPALNKLVSAGRQPDGSLKILIFGVNREVFTGRCVAINNFVTGIKKVIGSDPDGITIDGVNILWLNELRGVTVNVSA